MARQVCLPRSAEHGTRRDDDFLLPQSRVRARVHQAAVWHHECHLRKRPTTDHRLLVQGKFAICLGCRDAPRAKSQGLPVDEFDTGAWKEGESLSTGGGSISLIKGAPNPNAARVFINWFLSRKGQIALQKHLDLYGELPPNSRRTDIPKEDLTPESRLIKGRKYLDVSRPEWQDMETIFKLVKEVTTGRDKK